MNIRDYFSLVTHEHIQGIEKKLRQRRRNGWLITTATVLWGIFEVISELASENEDILQYLSKVLQSTLLTIQYVKHSFLVLLGQRESLLRYDPAYDVLGFYLIIIGIIIYYLNRHTAFLLKTSEEPFQYTFWISRFKRAENRKEHSESIPENDEIHHLLHHDLMDMLNRRIGRFSLLDEQYFNTEAKDETPPSHIHIDGHYTIRTREYNGRVINVVQVMPRVRIGPPGNPSILTVPVEVEIDNLNLIKQGTSNAEGTPEKAKTNAVIPLFSQEIYNQALEQVYSKVASEIYKQIRYDIKQKIHLFPTKYLQAVALYHEAEDFSRSNTIDSYDYAIELYKEALRFYDISIYSLVSKWLLYLKPLRLGIEYEMMYASTKIGYFKCLIYRREISSLTGRTKNALYQIPFELDEVVNRLIKIHNKFHIWKLNITPNASKVKNESERERNSVKTRQYLNLSSLTFKKDSWHNQYLNRKLDFARFEELKQLLFDAYVVLALTYADFGAIKIAEDNLKNAKATHPKNCDSNALFLLTKAKAELDLQLKIPFLIQSTEMAPDFEIAQYSLANYLLYLFLAKGEVEQERADLVIKEFTNVFKINPSNIASFTHLGYLYWLIDDLEHAQIQFEQGIKTKTIVQQTFIGELNYGLARIAAKKGEFNKCYDLYRESLSSEPGLGAYSTETVGRHARTVSFYEYIMPSVLSRYERFKENFENQIQIVFVRFYEEDIKYLQEINKVFENDQYRILQYIQQKTTPSSSDRPNQSSWFLNKESVAKLLNELMPDTQFCEHIIHQNGSLTNQINKIKENISFDEEVQASVIRLNRHLLELLYPEIIKTSGFDEYLKKYSCRRKIYEDSGDLISITTLNQSYSYVLNDFGNACLNYYHRFGDIEQLDKAIASYEKAIALNPKNGIVYYNIANAILWRYRPYIGSQKRNEYNEYLQKADKFMSTSWPTVIINNVKAQMENLQYRIEQEQKAIQTDEDELKKLNRKIKELQNQQISKRQAGLFEISKPMEAQDQPPGDLEKVLNTNKAKRKKIESELPKKKHSIKNIEREFKNKFTSAIKRTIELSKLTAIIEGAGIDLAGSSVSPFIDSNIAPEQLDEKDIHALMGWSELLSINKSDKRAIKASINLGNLIAKYSPQSFNIDYILFLAFQKLDTLEVEEMLQKYRIDWLIDKNELEHIFGADETAELVNQPPGTILKSDEYRLNQIRTKLQAPFFKINDIKNPKRLLASLISLKKQLSIDSEIDELTEVKRTWNPRSDSAFKLIRILNRLLETHLCKEGQALLENFSQRTRELIEFEFGHKLKGQDLIRVNRRILEELFPEEITKSPVELFRERVCEMIRESWLAFDPIFYIVLDGWAKFHLIFPEFEEVLKNAIEHNTPNVHEFHKMLSDLYERPDYKKSAKKNFENAIRQYPQQGVYHLKLSKVLRQDNKFEESRKQIREARKRKIIKSAEYDQELKEIFQDEANHFIDQANWPHAISKYKEALTTFPDDNDFQQKLVRAEKAHKKQKIANHYGEKWVEQLLIVTPIAVEVAGDLIHLVEGEGNKLKDSLLALIEGMRSRILNDFGVRIPGIRFRGNEFDFERGTYVIMLNEVPSVTGNIKSEQKWFIGARTEVEALGVQSVETSDPLTGETAYWIDTEDMENLDTKSMTIRNADEYLIRHLELILQQNLVEFLGHQEVFNLIYEKHYDKKAYFETHLEDSILLTTVLRGLVGEKVPITAFSTIAEYVEQHHEKYPNVTNLINEIRLLPKVKESLPGNRDISHYFKLSAQLEEAFLNALYEEKDQFFLAMQPETCQEILAAVRNKIGNQKSEAIIVTNKRLRPLVNQLLKLEFPNISIISKDELLEYQGNSSKDIAEIDFE